MSFLAAGGGFTVIVGVILVMLNLYRSGRIIISFGTCFGIIVIIVCITYFIVYLSGIITSPLTLSFLSQISGLFCFNFYFGLAGTVLAVIGRRGFKKPKEMAKETSTAEDEEASEVFDTQVNYWPNRRKDLPLHASGF
jgi:vacuolar-type H+-ATPase subunit I/STV1